MANTKNFFTKEQRSSLVDSIKEAELNTSGEIRVHIEKKCKKDVLDRAATIYGKLKMHKTKLRNGVLFYLAIKDHKFAILGDEGINDKVPENFWENIKAHMLDHFKDQRFCEGLTEGIKMAGQQLKAHFPYQNDDLNELPDDVSFDEK